MTTVIQEIESTMCRVRAGVDPLVQPGRPESFTRACVANDAIRQGDLYLVIADTVPAHFIRATDDLCQLVPGNTEGARHCLDSLEGVTKWYPPNWSIKLLDNWSGESLEGPVLVLAATRVARHPTHGPVKILAETIVACHYQREFDAIEMRERRALD